MSKKEIVPVPKEDYQEGLKKCIINGNELLECAKILLDNDKCPQSKFLSIQASEEYGKALLLLDEIINDTSQITKTRWKKYYCDHEEKLKRARKAIQDKIVKVTHYETTISLEGRRGKEIPEERTIRDIVEFTYQAKIESLYVDYKLRRGYREWVSPIDEFDVWGKSEAESSFQNAELTKEALIQTIEDQKLEDIIK